MPLGAGCGTHTAPVAAVVEQPNPAQCVREHLAAARLRGEPFRMAWPRALDAALPHGSRAPARRDLAEWSTALQATQASFRRAYQGQQATDGDLAAARLEAAWP